MTYREPANSVEERLSTLEGGYHKLDQRLEHFESVDRRIRIYDVIKFTVLIAVMLSVIIGFMFVVRDCNARDAVEGQRRCRALCSACQARLLWTDDPLGGGGFTCVCAGALDGGVVELREERASCQPVLPR